MGRESDSYQDGYEAGQEWHKDAHDRTADRVLLGPDDRGLKSDDAEYNKGFHDGARDAHNRKR